jgi:hypothetical protein
MRVPPEYTAKVEKIKNIILSRSGLISKYGLDSLKIEVDEFYDSSERGIEEIVFILRINNIDCDDCDFEPQIISKTILDIKNKLVDACSFYISPTLELKSSKSSLRGVLFYDCKLWRAEFQELSFGIFYDVGEEY